jgi:hypothetical protein
MERLPDGVGVWGRPEIPAPFAGISILEADSLPSSVPSHRSHQRLFRRC